MGLHRVTEQAEEVHAGDHEGGSDRQRADGPDHLLILDLLAEQSVDRGPQQRKERDSYNFV